MSQKRNQGANRSIVISSPDFFVLASELVEPSCTRKKLLIMGLLNSLIPLKKFIPIEKIQFKNFHILFTPFTNTFFEHHNNEF